MARTDNTYNASQSGIGIGRRLIRNTVSSEDMNQLCKVNWTIRCRDIN